MGPIQVFIFSFEDFEATGAIAEQLEALSDTGTIRVIDARMLYKPNDDELVAVQASDLDDIEREDLRAAAGALIGLGAGAVLGGDEETTAAGMILGADAALGLGEIGMTDAAQQVDTFTERDERGAPYSAIIVGSSSCAAR